MSQKYRKCIVPNCNIKSLRNPEIKFIKYPKFGSDKFYIWDQIIGVKTGRGIFYICRNHFTRDCFGLLNENLKKKAVPSLALSIEDPNIDNTQNLNLASCAKIKTYINKNKYANTPTASTSFSSKAGEKLKLKHLKTYPGLKLFEKEIDQDLDKFDDLELLRIPERIDDLNIENQMEYLCSHCEKEKQKTYSWWIKYNKLKLKFKQLRQRITVNKKKIKYINKKKVPKREIICNEIQKLKTIKTIPKLLCSMLLRHKTLWEHWAETEKELALALYFKSPSFYNYLKDLDFRLPSRSTLNTWLPVKTLSFGIHEESFAQIKAKFENCSSLENECVLVFDEMHIKSSLDYNIANDLIDGVCTDGICRSNVLGKEVCVFMVRGLFSSWNFVVGHFLSNSAIKKHLLAEHVKNLLAMCFANNIRIRALVCDQGSNNRGLYKSLGISCDKPYYIHNNSTKIFGFYCTPHLIKSVRNIFMANSLKTKDGNPDFEIIKKVYEFDKQNSVKMCPKLTVNHIDPDSFAKMRVCYATQILSNSVASAINLSLHLNKFEDSWITAAKATEIFVKTFNDLFDFFNSDGKNLESNDCKTYLNDAVKYIQSIEIIPKSGKKKKTVYAFKGFLQNIFAISELSKILFDEYIEINDIPTRRVNQDILEGLFSLIRGKGGNNRNPSAIEFNSILKFIINMKAIIPKIKRKSSNCLLDKDLENSDHDLVIETLNVSEIPSSENLEPVIIREEEKISDEFNITEVEISTVPTDSEQSNNIITYFVSYVSNKIIEKVKCEKCSTTLLKDNSIIVPREYLLLKKFESKNRNYTSASTKFFEFCKVYINYFQNTFQHQIHVKNIKKMYTAKCIELTNEIDSDWYSENNPCYEHRIKALNYLLLILLRKNCQWMLDAKKDYSGKVHILRT